MIAFRDTEKMLPVLEAYRSSLLLSDCNTILSKRVSSLLLKLRQKHFKLGDKPEKLLASRLRVELSKTKDTEFDFSNFFANLNTPQLEFYKAFHDKLAPLMSRMVNDARKNKLLSSLYEANIGLLLKKGKEETYCYSSV